jgi:hypothetical protein
VALLERVGELRALGAAVQRVAAGDSALVMIEGASGIGKSALLGELGRMAAEAEMLVLSARGTSLEADLAWTVVRRLLVGPVAEVDADERLELLAGAAGAGAASARSRRPYR